MHRGIKKSLNLTIAWIWCFFLIPWKTMSRMIITNFGTLHQEVEVEEEEGEVFGNQHATQWHERRIGSKCRNLQAIDRLCESFQNDAHFFLCTRNLEFIFHRVFHCIAVRRCLDEFLRYISKKVDFHFICSLECTSCREEESCLHCFRKMGKQHTAK